MTDRKGATSATRQAHEALQAELPADLQSDGMNARRGFIGTLPDADVPGAWSMAPFAFLEGERPDTVNPSLWRQAKLNALHGLFEVTPGIYQVRGFDLANITFIEGEHGYIVVDPLTSAEPAAAALKLLRRHRGEKSVSAVIYTHCHTDHYGGVRGVISDEDVAAGLQIVAPEGFLKAAISETVLLGAAMGRRADYMYGGSLPRDAMGHVDAGLGKALSTGAVSLIPPTVSIRHTGQRMTIDGVEIVFQMTPDTEAPAEMNFFFPQFGALCMAENCTCLLHNVYTPRGAAVRDARAWSHYIDEALHLFAADTKALFASHHWPRWGADEARTFLKQQRDLYKYIHDQTVRLANQGLTSVEIAEILRLPPTLAAEWHTRGLYGTLSHNTKAVYQKYLGWFDGNPANLHKLPPVEVGRRVVELAGGADALLTKARDAFQAGDYRWVAELVNHLVFADPTHVEARRLQADTLEQLGYQTESGAWRSFYLTGAMELRADEAAAGPKRQRGVGLLRALPAAEILEFLSVHLNGETAAAETIAVTLAFEDTGDRHAVSVENAVLHHREGDGGPAVRLTRAVLLELFTGRTPLDRAVADGRVAGEGVPEFARLLALLEQDDRQFNIVLP